MKRTVRRKTETKASAKTTTKATTNVTDLATVRNRRKAISPSILEKRADIATTPVPGTTASVSAISAVTTEAERLSLAAAGCRALPGAETIVRRDRVAELLAGMGFQDGEIDRIKVALPILPIDAELVGRARAFVVRHASGWNHEEWVGFVGELADAGYAIGVDSARFMQSQRFVGVLVEAIRVASFHALDEKAIVKAA
jgi:hypothetical protein